MSTVDDRLLELLAQKDAQLASAHERIDSLERQIDAGLDWMRQERLNKDEAQADSLPVPRVQLELLSDDHWCQEWTVLLVSARPWGGQLRVPLEMSKRSGGEFPREAFPLEGVAPPHLGQHLPNIAVDAKLYAQSMGGLPLAVVLDDERQYLVQPVERGWSLLAVPARTEPAAP